MTLATEVIESADSWYLPDEWAAVLRIESCETKQIFEKAFKDIDEANAFATATNDAGHNIVIYDADEMTRNYNLGEANAAT